jgi:hypothetical protein
VAHTLQHAVGDSGGGIRGLATRKAAGKSRFPCTTIPDQHQAAAAVLNAVTGLKVCNVNSCRPGTSPGGSHSRKSPTDWHRNLHYVKEGQWVKLEHRTLDHRRAAPRCYHDPITHANAAIAMNAVQQLR